MGLLQWPNLRPRPDTTALVMDMVTNLTGPATMVMDFHPHAGAAVAKDPLRLMPNLDIMDMVLDITVTHMVTDSVLMDPVLLHILVMLPLSLTEAPKALEERDLLTLNLRLKLMLKQDITGILTMDMAITVTDMVFLDVALPTLEVTIWERGLLRLRLNLHITVLDMDMAITDLISDTVLTDLVLPDTHLVPLSHTEVSKVSASKCAISDVV